MHFKISCSDADLIAKIVDRAIAIIGALSSSESSIRMELSMDLTACHANGTPLRLADLLTADDTNFVHDVFGIHRHINRETGQLENCFRPRFAVPSPSRVGRELSRPYTTKGEAGEKNNGFDGCDYCPQLGCHGLD